MIWPLVTDWVPKSWISALWYPIRHLGVKKTLHYPSILVYYNWLIFYFSYHFVCIAKESSWNFISSPRSRHDGSRRIRIFQRWAFYKVSKYIAYNKIQLQPETDGSKKKYANFSGLIESRSVWNKIRRLDTRRLSKGDIV